MPKSPDMALAVFTALRKEFLSAALKPKPFGLRDKENTQDDPLDEHIASRIAERVDKSITVVPATGPLISPDMVVATPEGVCEIRDAEDELGTAEAIGVEVKKLQRSEVGRIARPGGIDYNTTPPSKTISVFYENHQIDLPGFYLFVCLEGAGRRRYRVSAFALCDGGVLNEDVELYKETTGRRQKAIDLGSYGDGLDRQRPMLVFANPLGWSALDNAASLIHRRDDLDESGLVRKIGEVERTNPRKPRRGSSTYFAYRLAADVAKDEAAFAVTNPFPAVEKRSATTQARGRFLLDL